MTDQEKITALRDALQNMLEAYGEESGRTCVVQAHEALAMTAEASEPVAHITISQVGVGDWAVGYVRGWNDCVDATRSDK